MGRVLATQLLQLEEYTIVSLILKIEVLNLEQTLLTEYACLKTQFSQVFTLEDYLMLQGEIRGVVYQTVVNADLKQVHISNQQGTPNGSQSI